MASKRDEEKIIVKRTRKASCRLDGRITSKQYLWKTFDSRQRSYGSLSTNKLQKKDKTRFTLLTRKVEQKQK